MTREYLGGFSALELALAVLGGALFIGAIVWVFTGDGTNRQWQWPMIAALALAVAGRQLRINRIRREYRDRDRR